MKKLSVVLIFILFSIYSYSQEIIINCDGARIKYETKFSNDGETSKTFLFKIESLGVLTYEYPKIARENGIQGKVIVGFEIDNDCQIKNARITKGLGYGLDEIALQLLKCVRKKRIVLN